MSKELETELRKALRMQEVLHGRSPASLEDLRQAEARVQATAEELAPSAPEAAIETARREMRLEDLGFRLAVRAKGPEDPLLVPDPVSTSMQFLEKEIVSLAHELSPDDPMQAIDRASLLAERQLESQVRSEKLSRITGRLRRRAVGRPPTPHMQVRRDMLDLGRFDRLQAKARDLADSRAALLHSGDVRQIKSSLEAVPDPRSALERSLERIFREAARAREQLEASYRLNGELATLNELARAPETFGEIRGFEVPVFGDTPERSAALEVASQQAEAALEFHHHRADLNEALETARSLQRLQSENRMLVLAFPQREELLSDLGRHMSGLELHEVRSLLQPGQARIVYDVRRAERTFLEPIRGATETLLEIERQGVPHSPVVRAMAQRTATLFQQAPQHILKRLTPPQMRGALVAASIVHKAARRVVEELTLGV